MTDPYDVTGSDRNDRWPQRIAALARIVGHLAPAGALDPDAWLQTLTLARLIEALSSESGVRSPCAATSTIIWSNSLGLPKATRPGSASTTKSPACCSPAASNP